MADFEKFAGKVLQLEGAFAHSRNYAFTFKTLLMAWPRTGSDVGITEGLILAMTERESKLTVKAFLWDFFQADKIARQSVAEFIAEWAYKSDRLIVARLVQKKLGVATDGIFGPITLAAIDQIEQESFYDVLKMERKEFDPEWPKVELLRTYQEKQTVGELYVEGIEFCKTLELKWLNNMRSKSCIPEGVYKVVKRLAHEKRKYNHFHIINVPNRSYILIHIGNYTSQILGCVLVGDKHTDINRDGLVDVTNSTVTLGKLYELTPDEFDLTIRKREIVLSM